MTVYNDDDKPDNSETFFSGRQFTSTVIDLKLPLLTIKPVSHPYRYFVAAGESLRMLEQFIAESKTVDEDLKVIAKEAGATAVDSNRAFAFNNPVAEPVIPQMRLMYRQYRIFISNITAPGNFFPDLRDSHGCTVQNEIMSIRDLPANDLEAARAALAKKYNAESFDGKFFHFKGWEHQVDVLPERHNNKMCRLKCNPAFIAYDQSIRQFTPDFETDEGFRIGTKVNEVLSHRFPEQRFAQWISSFTLDICLHGKSTNTNNSPVEAEKIGDEWIIKVPVITECMFGEGGNGGPQTGNSGGEGWSMAGPSICDENRKGQRPISDTEGWVLPPGAKSIAISEYYAKLEASGSLRAQSTSKKTS